MMFTLAAVSSNTKRGEPERTKMALKEAALWMRVHMLGENKSASTPKKKVSLHPPIGLQPFQRND